MAWKPDYCSAAELKAHLRISDSVDDTPLGVAITAASRAIDYTTNRQFGNSTATARYYEYDGLVFGGSKRPMLAIDDLQSLTSLAVALDNDNDELWETTIVNDTDFDLWPYNAAADGEPWTHLVLRSGTSVLAGFPVYERSVKITGIWGWTSVPTVVKQACLIQAARFFIRRDAAFGIAGSPDAGSELRLLARLDPDVALMLAGVTRRWGAV